VAIKNRSTLKGFFTTGAVPSQTNFEELIDSMLIQDEDGIAKQASGVLKIDATGDEQELLSFYAKEGNTDPVLSWQLNQKPAGKPGLNISDSVASRLFIETDTGNVGIDNTSPVAKLDIQTETRTALNGINHPTEVKGLYVTAAFKDSSDGVEFRHTNGSQGIGFGYNTIYATGTNANQPLGLKPRGNESVIVQGPLVVTGNTVFNGNVGINATPSQPNKLRVEGGAISTNGNLHTERGRLAFSDSADDQNHTIYNNFKNIDGEGVWDGMKMNVLAGLSVRVGNVRGKNLKTALYIDNAGKTGIGTTKPTAKLEVVGTFMEKLDLIRCGNRGDWTAQNHPIMRYFKGQLRGKPVGTMMRAITDHPGWRGHYWQGWVDADSKIHVIHNYYNKNYIAL